MNTNNYIKWLEEKLIPNIPEDSVIVMDNAAYHNTRLEKLPTSVTRKSEMQEWLTKRQIPYDKSMKKVELYEIIKKNKADHTKFAIDELLQMTEKRIEVLRLPPYHPDLNCIENVWGILKGYVATHNIAQNAKSVEELIHEGFNKIGKDTWEKVCRHAIDNENRYYGNFDLENDFIINLASDESTSESDNDNMFEDISDSDC